MRTLGRTFYIKENPLNEETKLKEALLPYKLYIESSFQHFVWLLIAIWTKFSGETCWKLIFRIDRIEAFLIEFCLGVAGILINEFLEKSWYW